MFKIQIVASLLETMLKTSIDFKINLLSCLIISKFKIIKL